MCVEDNGSFGTQNRDRAKITTDHPALLISIFATEVDLLYLKLILTTFFWGGTFVAARYAVGEAPPFFVAACRYVIATVALFGLLALRVRASGVRFPFPTGAKQWGTLFVLGAVGIFIYNTAFFVGLRLTTASNGSLIVAINPVMTAMLSAIWLKEAVRSRQIAGFALSLVGVLTIVSGGSWETLRHFSFNPGDLILVAAPVTWAVFSVMGKRVLDWCSPLEATSWASLFGALLLIPCAFLERSTGGSTGGLSTWGWIAVLQLALLGTVVGFVWWYEAIQKIGTARSALFVNLVPVFGVLLASLFLGEKLLASQLAGGLLVVGGVTLGIYRKT